jgi:hypothetical protein
VTALIAQALGIKLTSELSSELSQFAGDISEAFDNRRDATGCFAAESLASIAGVLERRGLLASPVVAGLQSGIEIGLKLRAAGLGVFGILSKMWIDPIKSLAIMEGIVRKREPRAFIENEIGQFDPWVSQAQGFLQHSSPGEKIRMISRMGDAIVCCTDQYLWAVDKALKKVIRKVAVVDISTKGGETEVVVVLELREKGKVEVIEVECRDSDQTEVLLAYLASQKIMIDMFKTSLL